MDAREVKNELEKKRHVQFSKIVVVFVTTAVTALCAATVRMAYKMSDADNMVNAVKAYIEYATIAFVAYSGNSAVEKWLTFHNKAGSVISATQEKNDGDG